MEYASPRATALAPDELAPLCARVERLWHHHGPTPPLTGLRLTRRTGESAEFQSRYMPSLCLVLQGGKTSFLGARAFRYVPGQCLIASHEVPVRSQIEASPVARPYLGLSLSLDPGEIGELMLEAAAAPPAIGDHRGSALGVAPIDPRLIEPLCRLLDLLDRPRDLPVLAPLIRREIAWLLLTGPLGPLVRPIGVTDGGAARLAAALRWIRGHFTETLSVAQLATQAGMSPATFHRQFKAATEMTPLQYQKRLRLQEARRLLVSDGADVASAAFATGYESPSQFSRDYRRLFGAPPGRDGQSLRRRLGAEAAER